MNSDQRHQGAGDQSQYLSAGAKSLLPLLIPVHQKIINAKRKNERLTKAKHRKATWTEG